MPAYVLPTSGSAFAVTHPVLTGIARKLGIDGGRCWLPEIHAWIEWRIVKGAVNEFDQEILQARGNFPPGFVNICGISLVVDDFVAKDRNRMVTLRGHVRIHAIGVTAVRRTKNHISERENADSRHCIIILLQGLGDAEEPHRPKAWFSIA